MLPKQPELFSWWLIPSRMVQPADENGQMEGRIPASPLVSRELGIGEPGPSETALVGNGSLVLLATPWPE